MVDDFVPDAAHDDFVADDLAPDKQAAPAPSLGQKLAQTWPARLLAPAMLGAALPGQVASGELNVAPTTPGMWSDEDEARLQLTNQQIVGRAVEAAPFASPTPAVMRGAGAEGILGVPTKGPITPTGAEIKAAAQAGYQHPTVQEVQLKGGAGPALADQIYAAFNQPGVDIHKSLIPRTSGVLDDLYKLPEPKEGESDPFLTVANLRTTYRQLGKAAASPDPTERLAAKTAQNSIHEFLANMPEQYVINGDPQAAGAIIQEANANYAAMSRDADLDTRLTRAYLRSAAANSGMNAGNTIRQRMADVASNPTLARRVPPDELAMIKGIAEGNTGENLTRYVSNFLGGGGGALAAAYSLTGHQVAPIAGYLLRRAYNTRVGQRADLLREAIRQRSPLGQQMLNEPVEPGLLGARTLPKLGPAVGQSIPSIAPAAAEDQPQRKAGGRVNARPVQNLPRGKDNLFIEPAKLTPQVQMMLDHNRERFAKHFNYADEFGSGDPNSYDLRGDYNCGRCNQAQGRTCLLIKKNNLNLKADSCRQWESIREGDPEMFLQREGVGPSAYGISKNGQGFGCHRCPFSKPAKNRDDRGRTRWCGLGGFHQTPTACCELNGAETV